MYIVATLLMCTFIMPFQLSDDADKPSDGADDELTAVQRKTKWQKVSFLLNLIDLLESFLYQVNVIGQIMEF